MRQRNSHDKERLSRFTRRLLAEWKRREWPQAGERIVVAVSGGADSTALLLALDEALKAGLLEVSLLVAHLDHGLRGEQSVEDARWVADLTERLGHDIVIGRASIDELARRGRDNLEQAARGARYEFLLEAARAAGARGVAVAHTLDDQAETVLLRLLRGSGAEGLGGMHAERQLEATSDVRLWRPLVGWARRADTEAHCRERGVEFRADEMNVDERFARVRVRRRLMPLLETFNPRAVEALARAAALLRDDAAALEQLAGRLLEEATREGQAEEDKEEELEGGSGGAQPLRVATLAAALPALRRRALRLWLGRGRGDLRRVELAHVSAIEKLLAGERGGRVAELPGGARVERQRGRLFFRRELS
jgi:tRNA(Ile)-lysidine synthase